MSDFETTMTAIQENGWGISIHRFGDARWAVWDDEEREWGEGTTLQEAVISAWLSYSSDTEVATLLEAWKPFAARIGKPQDVRIYWTQAAYGWVAEYPNGKSYHLGSDFEAAMKHMTAETSE